MDSMDVDSLPDSFPLRPRDRIVKRLVLVGVPKEQLEIFFPGLVTFFKDNKSRLQELVSAILPTDEEVVEVLQKAKTGPKSPSVSPTIKAQFRESMLWLQWLMFEGEPGSSLKYLAKLNDGQRRVCGAVWGSNDIAYGCRTCQHDQSCAICVPCFQNGNHKDHDYSVIYTGGGCCDCGDDTAWKREGLCSKHNGAQIQPLPEEFANSVGPVLYKLFAWWNNKLLLAETRYKESPRSNEGVVQLRKVTNELTLVVVEMILRFCKCGESLLSFVSRMILLSAGLLELLVRGERFLSITVVRKVHELLLEFLGVPAFKYEFGKILVNYYPFVVSEAIKESTDHVLEKYPLLSTFTVQIFTVPTLTSKLVKEMNLLTIQFRCLEDIFISCVGEDNHLQVIKLGHLYKTTIYLVQDVRLVMSHAAVLKYVFHEKREIVESWMRLLVFVQGMNPQMRDTDIHIEEENEKMHFPFVLCGSIANVHNLLVAGAFSVVGEETDGGEVSNNTYNQDTDAEGITIDAKVGRIMQGSLGGAVAGSSSISNCASEVSELKSESACGLSVPSSVNWLIFECLKAIDNWLGVDNTTGTLLNVLSQNSTNVPTSNFLTLKRTLSNIRKGRYMFSSLTNLSDDHGRYCSPVSRGSSASTGFNCDQRLKDSFLATRAVDLVKACNSSVADDNAREVECAKSSEVLNVLSLSDWADIIYDVSSHDISAHIPFHRLLARLLQKALERCYSELTIPDTTNVPTANKLSGVYSDFFKYILRGCQPYGFSAFVMEHPLRIRVFCAEVHAGMWRKNGNTALGSCEFYRSAYLSGLDLEQDLFLLQCCAALAPADHYISRIVERFGLSNYLTMNLKRCSEYEPVLMQEMLTLIIQIIIERRFCGLTTAEILKRELVYRLAIGDAPHSQLVKSLPPDLSKFGQLQEILDAIAVYNPSSINQGKYSLRLPYWKDLDLYHPRWNLSDLQLAEERYLRFCRVSALTTQLPTWKTVYPPFKDVAKIATCKMVLQIVRAVVFYSVFTDKLTESHAPDGVLLTALHLLSLGLDICFQLRESGDKLCDGENDAVPLLAFAGEEIGGRFITGASEQSLLSLLVLLMRMHKNANQHSVLEAGICNIVPFIESLLKKFAEIDSGCISKLQKLAPEIVNYI